MNSKKNYLNPISQWHSYTKGEFPKITLYNDVVDFLESKGFEKVIIDYSHNIMLYQLLDMLNKISEKKSRPMYFEYKSNDDPRKNAIRFCNAGRLDISNPIFYIYTYDDPTGYMVQYPGFIEYIKNFKPTNLTISDVHCDKICNRTELMKKFNKSFGW